MDIKKLKEKNIALAKERIKNSVSQDMMIINATLMIEEIDKTLNSLCMRIRDWLNVLNPELEKKIDSDEKLLQIIIKEDLKGSSMGRILDEEDSEIIKNLSANVLELFSKKLDLENYIKKKLEKIAPNLLGLLGVNITSKLLKEAKSLKRLAFLQSGTVQLLGAEKALFRHLKTKAKSPKYGIILNHKLVQESKNKGKTSRILADKISIAARIDYFKGEIIFEDLIKQVKNARDK